jgi:hypothetical protein
VFTSGGKPGHLPHRVSAVIRFQERKPAALRQVGGTNGCGEIPPQPITQMKTIFRLCYYGSYTIQYFYAGKWYPKMGGPYLTKERAMKEAKMHYRDAPKTKIRIIERGEYERVVK